jgi:Ca2+-binding RTX toxin-like protein
VLLLFAFAISSPAPALTEAPQRKAPTCAGHEATIVGGPRGGSVVGTQGRDIIVLGNGWDTAEGRGGNDVICAGGGPDNVRGGAGRDLLLGGDDNDNLYGQAGKDRLAGNGGSDRLDGGALRDFLDGGRGARDDVAFSDAPRRVVVRLAAQLARGQGRDRLEGVENAGGSHFNDRLIGDGDRNILYGSKGRDEVRGGDGCDYVDGGTGPDVIHGGDDNDMVYDDVDPNRLFGGEGNDYLIGSTTGLGDGGPNGRRGDSCDAVGTAVNCEQVGGPWSCRV